MMAITGDTIMDRLRALYAFLFEMPRDGVLRMTNYEPSGDHWRVSDPRTGTFIQVHVTGQGTSRRLNLIDGGTVVVQ